ncbi:unnamed protein product [Amoebophrya sp. A25]|nr:unnamed protein product [Amoebophrya sp. A25]|eukprot:GSA25T00011036001.1
MSGLPTLFAFAQPNAGDGSPAAKRLKTNEEQSSKSSTSMPSHRHSQGGHGNGHGSGVNMMQQDNLSSDLKNRISNAPNSNPNDPMKMGLGGGLGGATGSRLTTASTTTAAAAPSKSKNQKQWTEKYRPKSLDAIAAQKKAVELLKACCRDQEFPSFLFHGPPGVGKTTAALAFCHELFGSDMERRVLELNASDERGIDAVRSRVKTFSQLSVGGQSKHSKLQIKVIILDEADQMTREAQSALRRIMEQHVRTTRFIILCNYVSRIIDPIHSRCMKFEFTPLPDGDHRTHLQGICTAEKIALAPLDLDVLLFLAGGDLRKSTTLLQMAHSVFVRPKVVLAEQEGRGDQIAKQAHALTGDNFYHLYQRVPAETLGGLMQLCMERDNLPEQRLCQYITKNLVQGGHSFAKVLDDLFDFIRQRGPYANVAAGNGAAASVTSRIPPMKVAYISRLIADANEAVSLWRGSEVVQMRHLFLQVRQTLTTPVHMEVPPPLPEAQVAQALKR